MADGKKPEYVIHVSKQYMRYVWDWAFRTGLIEEICEEHARYLQRQREKEHGEPLKKNNYKD